jgi:hypothetical protein
VSLLQTPLLDRLLSHAVIEPNHHAEALALLHGEGADAEPFDTLGTGLFWLLDQNILTDDDIAAIGSLADSQAAFPTNQTRKQALAEFDVIAGAVAKTQSKAYRRAYWRARFPGPSWRWLVAITVVVSALVWVAVAPDAVPACTDTQVAKTLRISLFQAMTRARTANPLATARSPGPNMLLAEFKDVRELGYIKAERARACEATLHAGDESSPMTYVIRGGEPGKTTVSTGNDRMVRARFALVDQDGKLPELGLPPGQANLQLALAAGVRALEAQRGPRSAARVRQEAAIADAQAGVPGAEPAETIGPILPLANCEARRREVYRCRVLMPYRDRLMHAIGRSASQVIEGEFDVVREGEVWGVAEGFPQQYLDATVRARVAEMAGEEAAARLERIQQERPRR